MRVGLLPSLMVFVSLTVLSVGCSITPVIEETFEFSSGGAYHLSGYGEWIVRLDADGNFAVKHKVGDDVIDYGMFTLTETEKATLWGQVHVAGIGAMVSSTRAGVPDEVQYTFTLARGAHTHEVKVWGNDVREDEALTALLGLVARMIERYSGETPVL